MFRFRTTIRVSLFVVPARRVLPIRAILVRRVSHLRFVRRYRVNGVVRRFKRHRLLVRMPIRVVTVMPDINPPRVGVAYHACSQNQTIIIPMNIPMDIMDIPMDMDIMDIQNLVMALNIRIHLRVRVNTITIKNLLSRLRICC
jgi:hypothetical protein